MPYQRVQGLEGSGHWVAVTPSDTVDLAGGATRGIYLGATGNVSLDNGTDSAVIFVALAAGVIHPIRATRVRATGTTATSILAIY
jgi:hypothetical protein